MHTARAQVCKSQRFLR